jgi:WD40 repeat protein
MPVESESYGSREQDYLYDAFISYRRSDGAKIANWLRRRLQDYKLPPKIAEGRRKLRVYLDTAFERANEDFWANNIEPALRTSRYLVVVATPDTLQPRADGDQNWVEREIDFFLGLPQGKNVLVVRAKGEFAAEIPARLAQRYPNITIVDMRGFSPLVDPFYVRVPLREHILTVLGTLHNIESPLMPELRMEDARHARSAATRLAIIALTLFVVISGLAIAALVQRNNARAEAKRADNNAEEARKETKIANDNADEAKKQTKIANDNADEAKRQTSNAVKSATEAKRQQGLAEENAATAQRNARESKARELAALANESLNEDPERSILLGMQAMNATLRYGQPSLPAAEDALRQAILSSQVRLTLRGHAGFVDGVAFSPDGKRLATASWDSTAKVWDAVSGQELLTLRGHSGGVSGVAFSPDGKRLATASDDATAKVWDAISGRELLTLRGHSNIVISVAFSPDGKRLATASGDDTAKVWDAVSGQELPTLRGHDRPVMGVAFSPDGKRLATTSQDDTAKVWDAVSGQELLTLRGHDSAVMGVAFSPDDKRLATASYDSTAKVWDAFSGQELRPCTATQALPWVWPSALMASAWPPQARTELYKSMCWILADCLIWPEAALHATLRLRNASATSRPSHARRCREHSFLRGAEVPISLTDDVA